MKTLKQGLLSLLTITAALSFGSKQAQASAAPNNCFVRHTKDLIRTSQIRKEAYARESSRESERVSTRFITMQAKRVSMYGNIDRAAAPYEKAGINVVCESLIDTKTTPELVDRTFGGPAISSYVSVEVSVLRKQMMTALMKNNFRAVYKIATTQLSHLDREPRLNCLMRSTLESIARVAELAPRHMAQAKAKNLPSTAPLSKRLIESHLTSLGETAKLDWKAAKVQERGVPVLCRDLPASVIF